MSTFWNPTSYGFAPVYWLTVGGIPVVFTERTLGLALPSGWGLEDASLVIDDSAEVGVEAIDRDRGVGVGLDFSFKLLDTDVVRDWLRRWSQQATITQDLLAGDTTAHVMDTTGWDSSGILYIGLERIQYNGKTGTTFANLTRATCGSLAATHKAGTTGQIVTDRPRHWRGRDVTLWASQADPSGHVCGSSMISQEAIQIWRGRITSSPERHSDGFSFNCQSLDRILDEQLAAKMSGDVVGTGAEYLLPVGWSIGAFMVGVDAADVEVWKTNVVFSPFAGMSATYKSSGEIRTLVSDAWAAAVVAAGAPATTHLGDWTWVQKGGKWHSRIKLLKDAAVYTVLPWLYIDGKEYSQIPTAKFTSGMKSAYDLDLNHFVNDVPPFCPVDPAGNQLPTGVTILLTEGDPSDVPPAGKVTIKSGDASCTYIYAVIGTSESDLHLEGLVPLDGQTPLSVGQFVNANAEILLSDQGAFDVLALNCLESSGTGLRGTYDVLARGAGYGLDASVVMQETFFNRLGSGAVGTLNGDIASAGASFVDLFGGVLSLFRLAVVAKPVTTEANAPIRLQVVDTAQGTNYTTTILDSDLLSHQSDPVVSVKRADVPNMISVLRKPGGQEESPILFNDFAAVEATGKREVQYRVDAKDRDALKNAALPAVSAHFAYDQTVQAIELLVHPGVIAEVGDAIWLTTTHPAVWTWSTSPGQVGYDGPGRVVGRKLNLKSGVATLTLLIDGSLKLFALSPAAEVTAYGGAAGAPTWIETGIQYMDHFSNAIANAGGPIGVLHYQPGEAETTAQKYNVSAAANLAGACRLTVSSQTGVFDLDVSKRSTLTLPQTANATTFQNLFAHSGDGSQWG